MTDHSDLIEQVQAAAEITGDELLQAAAEALSSQSLSLSEAREKADKFERKWLEAVGFAARLDLENARLKAAIEVAIGLFPHVRDDATQHALCVLRNALAAPALENGPAGLADATNDPASPSLSSLRKGAEVGQVVIDSDLVERAQHQLSASPFPFDRCVAAEISAALVSGSREGRP